MPDTYALGYFPAASVEARLAAVEAAEVPDATTTTKGKVELATDAEAVTGTDTTRAVTPSGLAAGLATVGGGTPPDASTTVKGIVELATNAETTTGTDAVRATTPAGVAAAIAAIPAVPDASETVKGKVELATVAETAAYSGADLAVTPVGLYTANVNLYNLAMSSVAGSYQPLDSDLNAIAALTTTSYGRSLLTPADAAAGRALLDAESGTLGSNVQSGTTYTIAASDAGLCVQGNHATGITISIPTAATSIAVGKRVRILARGAGPVTIDASAVTMNASTGSGTLTSFILSPRWTTVELWHRATDNYILSVLSGAANVGMDGWTYQSLGSDYTNSTLTMSDVFTGFAPAVSTKYEVEVLGSALAVVNSTGFVTQLAGPTSGITWTAVKITSANTVSQSAVSYISALNSVQNSTNHPTTDSLYELRAIVQTGAGPLGAGNVRLQGRSEVAASQVTMRAGSYMRWRVLP